VNSSSISKPLAVAYREICNYADERKNPIAFVKIGHGKKFISINADCIRND